MSGVIANLYEESALTVEGIIQNCTRIIENNETIAGAGRRMCNPLLNIFLGEDAENHIKDIQEAFYSCWSDHARNLKMLKGAYSSEDIEEAIVQSTQIEDRSIDTTNVRIAWFWDIMDDRFDRYFACVKQKYSMPIATGSFRALFIFCSQKDTKSQEKTNLRLRDQLIPWAEEEKVPLVILSDSTRIGILNQRGRSENYRLAASLMLLINSHYPLDDKKLGTEITFEMSKGGLWSGSYHGCSKNFYDIVGISLWTIIEKYRQLGKTKNEDFSQGASVQSRLCGADRSYYDLFDDFFEKEILPRCCSDVSLWKDIPYTQEIANLEEYVLHLQEPKGGFLGRLFGRRPREITPEEAIASVGDFWKCCVDMYYVGPSEAWIDSPEGAKVLKDYLYSKMTTAFNYDEMHALLSKESQYVASLNDNLENKIPRPKVGLCKNASHLLHGYAVREAKIFLYKKMLKILSEAMEGLCNNAQGFDDLLKRVQRSLREDQMERSVVKAYGTYMEEQLIEPNESILLANIRPCREESELLQQLETVFAELMNKDTRRVFKQSLQDDLEFRIQNGGAATAVNVISDCFRYNMADAGRLPTLTTPAGTLYCIMNDAMNGLGSTIATEAIGNRFIVSRSDRIERLFLFRVNQKDIMFSNNPA